MRFLLKLLVAATPLFCGLWGEMARAVPLNTNNPAIIARTHCRLMLKTLGDNRPLLGEVLDDVVGMEGYALKQGEETGKMLWKITGGLPDMGFMLGKYWDVTPAAQRREFNRNFSRKMLKQFRILNPVISRKQTSYKKSCSMKLSVRILADAERVIANPKEHSFPRRSAYRASAITTLEQEDGNTIPVTYLMEKEEPFGWQIVDIMIDQLPLKTAYQQELLEQRALSGGFRD